MLKRFPGPLLIGLGVVMALAGCGDSAGEGDGVPVRPTTGFAAGYPTATIEIPDTKAAAELLTGIAAFNAQRARGWPTPEGLTNLTDTPSPTPVDKSNWTIIEPGECDPRAATRAEELAQLRRKIFAFISRSWADDQAVTADGAALIIHGVPIGEIEMEPADGSGFPDRFYQEVRILSVLNGRAPGDTVRVVQVAFDDAISDEGLERDETTLGTEENHGYPGPLGQCPQIFFLNEWSADTYQSIGQTQRFFSLEVDGRVTYAPAVEPLYGLYVVREKERTDAPSAP